MQNNAEKLAVSAVCHREPAGDGAVVEHLQGTGPRVRRVAPKPQEASGKMIASGLITGEARVVALSGILTAALAFGK